MDSLVAAGVVGLYSRRVQGGVPGGGETDEGDVVISEVNGISIGDVVVVDWPKKMRWHEEPGRVLAWQGSTESGWLAVVACAGYQPLIPVEQLKKEE